MSAQALPRTAVLCWLRKSLRLHDNPALLAASREAAATQRHLIVAFLVDDGIVRSVGRNRRRFLLDALIDLDTQLTALHSRLSVFNCAHLLRDDASPLPITLVDGLDRAAAPMRAAQALCNLVEEQRVASVHFELCAEPYGSQRDRAVRLSLRNRGVAVRRWASATLADPRHLVAVAGRTGAPLTYQKFITLFERSGGALQPLAAPTELVPPPPALAPRDAPSVRSIVEPLLMADGAVQADEFVLLPGGETEGLRRLADKTASAVWVARFEKPESSPYALKPPSTTLLSPYLKFGCVSPRLVFARLRQCERDSGIAQPTQPPVSLVGQMMWREFFMFVSTAVGAPFGAIAGNPVCRQIPWEDDDAKFDAWRNGMTGYPAIDAAMRQLKQHGWLHHLARHSVACFATRGDLWLPWPRVARVFDELLLDGDFALNNANWMWLSASAFFHQFGRVYSPVAFAKKYGAEARAYVRHFVPELAHLSDKHVLEPWTAPGGLPRNYPARIVDHDVVRQINLDRMAAAYANPICKAQATSSVPFVMPFDDAPNSQAELLELGPAVASMMSVSATSTSTSDTATTAKTAHVAKRSRKAL
jgi:cryptochrome